MKKYVEAMRLLAERGHEGQYRRGPGNVSYIEHPKAVVELLKEWGETDDMTLAVAWGHDLFEDTDISPEDIHEAIPDEAFADTVVLDIYTLTNTDESNKGAYIKEVAAKGSQRAILVKCADRICNTRDFISAGRGKKAYTYLREAFPVFEATDNEEAKQMYDTMLHTLLIVNNTSYLKPNTERNTEQ